jgi:hypothetical protein
LLTIVPRLINLIQETSFLNDFKEIIAGFTDTLALFKKKFSDRKGKGQLTLSALAHDTLTLDIKNTHNANYDVLLLEKLATFHFDSNTLRSNNVSFEVILSKKEKADSSKDNILTFVSLQDSISKGMIKRLAYSGLNYQTLMDTYSSKGIDETIALLEQRKEGKPTMIKSKKILRTILNCLKNNFPCV